MQSQQLGNQPAKNTKNNLNNTKMMKLIVFEIKINTISYNAKLPNKKLRKTIKITSKILAN